MTKPPPPLHFDVSSGLKSVLGRELITDEHVAIFELVKNSFDAKATHVRIYFGKGELFICDDGTGMSLDDIKGKWLFVAYSSKRDKSTTSDYREGIASRRQVAGSKGIGRFSADRLGDTLILQTRRKDERTGPVHRVTVDWRQFDKDQLKQFDSIPVKHEERKTFNVPAELEKYKFGTVVQIITKRAWKREDILDLKHDLAKLINPFGAKVDGFQITIHAPAEAAKDAKLQRDVDRDDQELPPNALANGEVGNFVFATLQSKTTYLVVEVVEDGRTLESKLTDRGELVYHIREPNPYEHLASVELACCLFFLNQSAKNTFARRMGVPSVQFGSVFLFRNGFRVFPVGEEGDDWFGMDRRKQQGYARYLGSRDVIGRIDVVGGDEDFKEASSRNDGLIETPAVLQLQRFFLRHCLQRLERYVVPVTWADKEDKNVGDLSRLLTDPGRARVTAAVASLIEANDEIALVSYSKRLISILDERAVDFQASLDGLRAIAEKTKDRSLIARIDKAAERYRDLERSEAEARKQADEEREAKEAAQARATRAEAAARNATEQLEEEKKRNLFLTAVNSVDIETIVNMHHQITIYAVDMQQRLENWLADLSRGQARSRQDVASALENLAFLNRKVMAISKFATRANFRMESECITADLADYVVQYVEGVVADFLSGPMKVTAASDGKGFQQKFKPIDVSIVVDNLVSNSRKARATSVHFEMVHPEKRVLHIWVRDDGRGLDRAISPVSRVFEKGFSKTDGSGLGLYHVAQVLGEMGGSIEVEPSEEPGAAFLIRVSAK